MPRKEYVYIFEGHGLYKIGKAIDVKSRLQNYRTHSPVPIQSIHVFEATPAGEAESVLHNRFHAKRMHGEWFALNADDIALILAIHIYVQGKFYSIPKP